MINHDANEINLKIEDVQISRNCILFQWSADIGFGEYTIFYDSETGEWSAMTECLDSEDNKSFGRKLFELVMDKVKILE